MFSMASPRRPSVNAFYDKKTAFVTGATGMFGKCLVHRLLDATSIGKVYVLLRGKRGVKFDDRFKAFLDDAAFSELSDKDTKLSKLVAVEGDIGLPKLGLSDEDYNTLISETEIVYHSAATVKWNEPLRVAIQLNLSGTHEVIKLCREMSKFNTMVHVSSIACFMERDTIGEFIYHSPYNPEYLMKDAQTLNDKQMNALEKSVIGPLPKYCHTYMFTKTVTEVMIQNSASDLNIVIVRLPLFSPSEKHPSPGWVESLQINNAILIAMASGLIRSSPADANCPWQVLPVDMCCNALITTAWEVGTRDPSERESPVVYNIAPDETQSISIQEVSAIGHELGTRYPSINQFLPPFMHNPNRDYLTAFKFRQGLLLIYAYVLQFLVLITTTRKVKIVKAVQSINAGLQASCFDLHKIYYKCISDKIAQLYSPGGPLTREERELFRFEPMKVNYRNIYEKMYFNFRRNVLKEPDSNIEAARERMEYISEMANKFLYAAIAGIAALVIIVIKA